MGARVSALKAAHLPASGRLGAGNGNVDYNGGPVLHSSAPYLIFWDPNGHITAHSETAMKQYLSDAAADSGKATDVFLGAAPVHRFERLCGLQADVRAGGAARCVSWGTWRATADG